MFHEPVPELIESTVAPLAIVKDDKANLVSACEFVWEGLYARNKNSRSQDVGFEAVTKAKRDRREMICEDLTDPDIFN